MNVAMSVNALSQAASLALEGREHEAAALLTDTLARSAGPLPPVLRMFAARLFISLGRVAEALEQTNALRMIQGEGRIAALAVSAEVYERLGWFHEARAMLEDALAEKASASQEVRLAFLLRKRDSPERALEHLKRALALEPRAANIAIEAAGLAVELGRDGAAQTLVESAIATRGNDPLYLLESAHVCLTAGALDRARALFEEAQKLEPEGWRARLGLGRIALYQGRIDAAIEHAKSVLPHEPGAAHSLLACAELARKDFDKALASAEEALLRDERASEALLVRAEVALRKGRARDAFADILRALGATRGYCFAGHMLHHLAEIATTCAWSGSEHGIEEILAPLLSMFPDAMPIIESPDAEKMRALLEQAIEALSGNRSPYATMRFQGTNARKIPHQSGPRFESRRVLQSIAVEPPAQVLLRFGEVIERYPRSPTPLCHRGELLMWFGRYDDAFSDFESALAITVARWGYIGRGAAELCLGDPERALATFEEGVEKLHGTTGPSLFIYRGEAYLRTGRLDDALRDLRHSTESTPRRISAWLLLALTLMQKGDCQGADAALAEFSRRSMGLLYDARNETGIESLSFAQHPEPTRALLEHILVMMRGNRSSTCITYFTAEGQLRGVPNRAPDHDARHRRELESLAQTALRFRGRA